MSAMKVIDAIKEKGGEMILLSRFVAVSCSESDTNLWNYKFTWAPRNVVLAGQGGAAKFIQEERINTFRTVIYFIEPSFTSRRVWSF
jgi:hypothetical protein